jgi:O-antigen/teichoic acid export membrane protein
VRLCPGLRFRPFRAPRARYREVLGFGLRLQATRAFEVIGAHAPRLVLAAGPGLAAAGLYDLGARLAGLIPVAASLPLRVILPLAAHLDTRGEHERLAALVRHATRAVALLALAPLAVVLLEAEALLTAWIGSAPPPGAALCARLVAAGLTVGLAASPLRLVLRACGHAGLEAAATATGCVVLVAGALLAAAPYGAAGVAAAAPAGALCAAGVVAWRAASGRGSAAPPLRTIAAAVPAAAAALVAVAAGGLVTIAFPMPAPVDRATAVAHLARSLPFAALAFVAVSCVTGAVRGSDLALVRDAARPAPREARA